MSGCGTKNGDQSPQKIITASVFGEKADLSRIYLAAGIFEVSGIGLFVSGADILAQFRQMSTQFPEYFYCITGFTVIPPAKIFTSNCLA